MSQPNWKRFLGGLNIQFIAYFLLFAYIPLLSFSVIGYHLNKRLIRQVHEQNLEILAQKTSKHLIDYIDAKRTKIRILYKSDSFDSPSEELNEFVSVASFGLDDSPFFLKNVNDSLINILLNKKNVYLCVDLNRKQLFFKTTPDSNSIVWASIPLQTIRKLLNSDDPHTRFSIISTEENTVAEIEGRGLFTTKPKGWAVFSIFRTDPMMQYDVAISDKWKIRAVRSAQGIYGELENFLVEIFFGNLIIGILMFAIAVFLARRIAGPIEQLVLAANKFSEGDLSTPVNVSGSDEINILANEFEVMRQQLLESYSNLEVKIEERTEALREAQFQISHQEKMASLGLMAAGVAHEIGNPLTGISSMAQIIKRKIQDPEIKEYISTILSNIKRISRIVRELVDFSRPSSYEAAYVNANEVIKSAVGIARYDKRAKNIELDMQLDDDLPGLFLVEDQLQQVFINILINAMDACPDETGKLNIKSYADEGYVHIHFTDNGIGIPEENQAKIFEPFFTTKKVGKGTGLGLSVSYGIIKNLNGHILVESTPGKGSTFKIDIPFEKAE